jgi:adenylate cyclase
MDWLKAFQPPGRRQLLLVLLVTLGAVALSETALRRGWLDVVDTAYSDAWHRLAGMRTPPRHVALVTVDDAALKAHHDDPLVFWGPHLARAIERLRAVGARVIGLDLLLSMSPDGWLRHLGGEASDLARYHDAGLRAHIAAGDVVLVGSRGNGGGGYTLPHPDYLLAIPDLDLASHIGLADLHSDRDGVVRRFTGRSPPAADPALKGLEPPRLAFAALLAERAGAAPGAADETPRWITYVGPPGSIPRVSISRLEAPGFAQDPQVLALNGKVVIIGAYFSGMGDAHFTPYSTTFTPGGSLMSGAEVHANIVETLLSGRETRPLAGGPHLLVSGLSVLLLLGVMVRAGLTAGTLLGLALLVLAGVASYGAFERLWLVSTGAWQGSLLLGYMGGLGLMFTGEARRRAHLARVFRRYVSEAAVKVLLRSDTMPDLGGELCRVTVLFSDIRNFTTISEILTPAEVVEMLNEYFERACQPVLDEGGSIDKFIGDAIMAEFGAPMAAPDHALRAVRAALRMIETAEAFRGWMQHRFPDRGLPEFAIGVGIHTGEAILGSIGSRQRSEYTAIGDTVNVASRLEGITKEMGIAIVASRATISAAGGAVRWGPCSVVHVKGHNQTIEVFGITGLTEGKIDA